jgi:hypothetical protein
MAKKILTDLNATGRTITAGIFSGVANNDTINTITGATSTASFWSDVTTGTIGVGTGVTTGTISIGSGLTTGRVDIAVGSGSTPTSTVNINTGKIGAQNVTTNIGSATLGGAVNLYLGSLGLTLNGTALIKTPVVASGSSIGLSITTGQGVLGANSGSVTIDAGSIPTGAGTAGTVLIGNNYATGLTIGRSGVTTTINGTLVASAPAGSLTGSSLASGITTASGLTTASSLASVGTITSGTWNATAIGASKGGTGQTSFTQYGVAYGASSTALAETAAGTTGQVLAATSTAPVWATPFFMPRPSGDYYVNGQYASSGGPAGTSTTSMAYVGIYLPAIQTVTSIGFTVTSTGVSAVYQLGLYSNNTSTNKPDTKLLDAGLISVTATGAQIISGLSYTLTSPGWYWVGIQLYSGSNSTISTFTTTNIGLYASIMPNTTTSITVLNTHWLQTITAAQALPTTAGTVTLSTTGAPKVFVGI